MSLPSGYRKLEYIESSGTQYIDTGFLLDYNDRVVMTAQFRETPSTEALFGVRNTVSDDYFCYYRPAASGYSLRIDGVNNIVAADPTQKLTIDANGNVLSVGDSSVTAAETDFTATYPLFLFADNNAGTAQYPASVIVYSCQIYDNGTLVRDFVPCMSPNGDVGLYDLVNGVFYSDAAGGTFTAGRFIYSESEITKLQYIESSGEQYLNTEFTPDSNSRIVIDAQWDGTVSRGLFGTRNTASSTAAGNNSLFITSGKLPRCDYYGNSVSGTSTMPTERITVDRNKNVITIGTETVTNTASTEESSYPLFLFAINTAGTAGQIGIFKLYGGQIYDNGILARDYYPATINGEVGLWDAESGIFYENAGTGSFIAGPQLGISSPQNFTAVIEDGGVFLSWDAVSDAAGYRLYRDLLLLSEQSETSYTDDNTQNWHNYLYSVTAYDAENESTPASVSVQIRGTDPVLDLITDRTADDIAKVAELAAMDYKNMTDEQKRLWHSSLKGAYNAGDLNRVETAVEYLADILRFLPTELREHAAALGVAWDKFFSVPYDAGTINPSVKTDWLVTDIQTPEDMERYLANVKLLREVLSYSSDTLPASMENLRWQYANAIEKALVNLDAAIIALRVNKKMYIENTAAAWFRSGEIFSGEV